MFCFVLLDLDKERSKLSLSFIDHPIMVICSIIHLANSSSSQSLDLFFVLSGRILVE